jgi:hypothetical protein
LSLPPPMLPDPSAFDEMHRTLGKVLTRWQYVETGLYIVASLAFFQIKSAENKLEFVDAY